MLCKHCFENALPAIQIGLFVVWCFSAFKEHFSSLIFEHAAAWMAAIEAYYLLFCIGISWHVCGRRLAMLFKHCFENALPPTQSGLFLVWCFSAVKARF